MQALPHMLHYDDAIVVVKYGGHAMGDDKVARDFARDMVLLEQSGVNPVVVHGGGPQIGAMLNKLGIKSEFSDGLRVTDKATVEIVEMVLAGSINKQIVGFINAEGGRAIGLCGKDGNMVIARKVPQTSEAVDLGFVGEPAKVDTTVLDQVLGRELIPVLAPVAQGDDGETYNVNADTFAGAIAGALKAKRLLFLTDVPAFSKGQESDQAIARRRDPRPDRRRHHYRRHDPQGRDLHLCAGARRRRRRHPRRQDAPCRARRAFDRSWRGNIDHTVNDTKPVLNAQYARAARAGDAAPPRNPRPRVDAFSHKDIWVFDLDNTLYPADSDLWPKIDARITLFLAHLFGLDGMSSRALQKYYYQRYGTTLRGLMEEHGISAGGISRLHP